MSTREDINVKHKYAGSLLRVLEIAVLFAVITVICGLYMLPTLFYVRPPIDQVQFWTHKNNSYGCISFEQGEKISVTLGPALNVLLDLIWNQTDSVCCGKILVLPANPLHSWRPTTSYSTQAFTCIYRGKAVLVQIWILMQKAICQPPVKIMITTNFL